MAGDDSNNSGNDFEVSDVENYRGDKFQVFNHQILVMEVLRRVNESGSHELRPGWFNEKVDRQGNTIRSYVEDTRSRFIECVKTAMMVMDCDYDGESTEFIEECKEELSGEKCKLLKAQWDWFKSLPPRSKSDSQGMIIEGVFNKDLGWFTKYMELEVECYRAIALELNSLTKRLDFYQTEDFEA